MAKVVVYAAGGAAVNICKELYRPHDDVLKDEGFAELQVVFIDTSRSNFPKDLPDSAYYLVQGTGDAVVDGSGKVRDTNYKAASLAVPDILHGFRPGDLSIVVHSSSGGSGSVCGPLLAAELLAQGKAVIVLQVGSTTCEQEIKNTINTLLSYQGIVTKRNLPVVSLYLENSKQTPSDQNDVAIRYVILLLAAIWSGENLGLDSKDLDNFLNYQRVSKYTPAFTGLKLYTGDEAPVIEKGQAVSSVVSLIREGEDSDPGLLVGYHSYGILSQAASEAIKRPSPIHLHTVQGFFTDVVVRLQEKLKEAEEQYRVNPVTALNISHVDIQDDGLVL